MEVVVLEHEFPETDTDANQERFPSRDVEPINRADDHRRRVKRPDRATERAHGAIACPLHDDPVVTTDGALDYGVVLPTQTIADDITET